jgi:GNAT superfamily N-acetyltransferase
MGPDIVARMAEILREDDPRRADLEAAGYRIVAESWGARLRLTEPPDLTLLKGYADRARAAGFNLRELTADDADALHRLDAANLPDYPDAGPATAHELLSPADLAARLADKSRAFGAFDDGRLVGATVVEPGADRWETAFTSVLASHRGRGLGAAVKACSIIALAAEGVRTFGTGGAATNAASLAANRALGYTLEPRWLTYAPPP